MDYFFSYPRLFDDLERHKINSCRTVQPYRKDMRSDFRHKITKLTRSDVMVKIRRGLTALVSKDSSEVYVLSNIDPPPAEGNFGDNETTPETSYSGTEQPKHELR